MALVARESAAHIRSSTAMHSDSESTLAFTVPNAAGVHTDASGARVTLWIPDVEGLAALDRDGLRLQYRVRDRAASYDSGVRELRIPLESVADVRLQRRWLGPSQVVIRVSDLRVLDGVAWAKKGELVLRVAKSERDAAQDLVAAIALAAAERA